MANSTPLILVLGATGKTGGVANNLTTRGLAVRTAARSGADVRLDWDEPGTYAPALEGVDRVYLLGPVMRTDFAGQVTVFLDQAEAAGVRHITYLSAYGIDAAPPEMAMRSVELDLLGRQVLLTPSCDRRGSCRTSPRRSSSRSRAPSRSRPATVRP